MKFQILFTASLLGALCLKAQTPVASTSLPDYQVVQQDANTRVWQRQINETGPNGEVAPHLQSFTEIASGLNYLDGSGQWQPSSEEIDIQADGTAAAVHGQHQVYFPVDILNGNIEMVTPDGKQVKSQPTALAYDDGNHSVLIAILTNSVGQVVGENQVIYTNAFSGINADILYTYKKSGFEQDIVLHESPPTPGSLGLNPNSARLEVLTEFLGSSSPVECAQEAVNENGMGMTDSTLDFGRMQMVPGKAFKLGESTPSVRVCKSWVTLEGRHFLVEQVPVLGLTNELESLPAASAQAVSLAKTHLFAHSLQLPPQHWAKNQDHSLKLARANLKWRPGVVLDYNTINTSLTNYTFQGDTTYYVSGNVYLYGTNTFDGGTVLKYASGASVTVETGSQLKWGGAPYLPVTFTAKDDNNMGQILTGSTGSPSGYYANPALAFTSFSGLTLSNYRILYAQVGILATASSITNYNCQFVDCENALTMNQVSSYAAYFRNALFANVLTNFDYNRNYGTADLQNCTFNNINCLVYENTGGIIINSTNSIIANVTNLYAGGGGPTVNGANNGFYKAAEFGSNPTTNAFNPFQTVGAGNYYLTNGSSFHGAGTTNLDSVLSAELTQRTTYGPTVYGNVAFHTNLVLGPIVMRDTNAAPDLGYHYDALDYIFGGCDLFSNLTFTTGTAIGWYENTGGVVSDGQPYGMSLNSGANLTIQGNATSPAWVARFDDVQEGCNNVWPNRSWMGGFMFDGSGGVTPQINANFTKWAVTACDFGDFRDNWAQGEGTFNNCEFYLNNLQTYAMSYLNFTNCLFYRIDLAMYDQDAALSFNIINCTFYDGFFVPARKSGQGVSYWVVNNTVFDGTGFTVADNLNGNTNYTSFNFNAYNTNNLSGLSYPYPYATPTNYLETVGPNDLKVGGYNWQNSWFGNFYLPINSPLINAGSANANLLGFYYFTTQTTQAIESNSIVDIGHHYVATDSFGNPLATFGDGIPNYIDDPNGNGLPNWWQLEYFGNLNQNATNDSTGDGYSDATKYISQLIPTNYNQGQLASWSFQDTNLWTGDQGQLPLVATNIGWVSNVIGNNIILGTNGSLLAYRGVETTGNANINSQNGSISLMFNPQWSSESTNGFGPGDNACLVEVTGGNRLGYTNNWWSLGFNSNGNQLFLITCTNGLLTTNISANVSLISNNWYNVIASYCPTGTCLFLNGQAVTNGGGLNFPMSSANELFFGGDKNGSNQINGSLGIINTFNYLVTTNNISTPLGIPEFQSAGGTPVGGYCGPIQKVGPIVLSLPTVSSVGWYEPEPLVTNETVTIPDYVSSSGGAYGYYVYGLFPTIWGGCVYNFETIVIYMPPATSLTLGWAVYQTDSGSALASGSSSPISYVPDKVGDEYAYLTGRGVLGYPVAGSYDYANPIAVPISVFPRMRLGFWSFNDPNLVGDRGQLPLVATGCTPIVAPFGNGLFFSEFNTNDLEYSYYQNDDFTESGATSAGTPNFRWDRGTVRFWFSPDWNSGSEFLNGSVFLQLQTGAGTWSLLSTNSGSTIDLNVRAPNSASHFSQSVTLSSSSWYQIAVTYSSTEVTLYINGQQVGSSVSGIAQILQYVPGQLHVGSLGKTKQCGGTLENLETFNYELSSAQIQSDYDTQSSLDTDGAGISDLQQFEMGINPSDPPGGGNTPQRMVVPASVTAPTITIVDPANAVEQ